jgi:hypothetical protein
MEILEMLAPKNQLELAVLTKSPTHLARVFASQAGQFYNRSEFDALARRTRELYAADSVERATLFRARLDRRLHDRYHDAVTWDVSSSSHAVNLNAPAA